MTVFRDPTHAACPRCRETALSGERTLAVVHHRCAECRGIWFDRAELDEIGTELSVSIGTRIGEPTGAPPDLPCPRCNVAMPRRQIHPQVSGEPAIEIDVCDDHGLWFDHEEFEAVLAALMAAEDRQRPPWRRTNRPWWMAAVQALFDALDAGPHTR